MQIVWKLDGGSLQLPEHIHIADDDDVGSRGFFRGIALRTSAHDLARQDQRGKEYGRGERRRLH
jgi:hypothetical protein